MTSISSINSSQTSSTQGPAGIAAAAISDTTASQDRFLKLLVAQLNNQDPMNPMDNAQMTSQMAQINTVTGIQQVNETLKSMATQFSSLQVLQGTSMVGRGVLIESNTMPRVNGIASGAIDLAGPSDAVKVDIMTPGGQVLDSFNLGALGAGRHPFSWDASSYQATGEPSYRVTATQGGNSVSTTSLARDTVVSVGSENGSMTVQLLGRGSVAYGDVKAIL